MKFFITAGIICAGLALTGCTPTIQVATPKDPITINMNVKIDHQIDIKADKDVESLIDKSQPK